jgi:hypothetical protein
MWRSDTWSRSCHHFRIVVSINISMLTSGGTCHADAQESTIGMEAEYGSPVPRRCAEHCSEQLRCEPNVTPLHMTTTLIESLGVEASSSSLIPTHAAADVLTRSKELLEGSGSAVTL